MNMIKKMVMAAMVMAVIMLGGVGRLKAQETTTVYFTFGAGYRNCIQLATVQGQPAPSGYYWCPNKEDSFSTWQPCNNYTQTCMGSLYLPPPDVDDYYVILEGLNVKMGAVVPLSYNPDGSLLTWQRTDTFALTNDLSGSNDWSGQITTTFRNSKQIRCARYGCVKVTVTTIDGGYGDITNPTAI